MNKDKTTYFSAEIVLRRLLVDHRQHRLAFRQRATRLAVSYPRVLLLIVSLVEDLHRRYR